MNNDSFNEEMRRLKRDIAVVRYASMVGIVLGVLGLALNLIRLVVR